MSAPLNDPSLQEDLQKIIVDIYMPPKGVRLIVQEIMRASSAWMNAISGYVATEVRLATVKKGVRKALNFISGTNISIAATDSPGTGAVDIQISATAGGTFDYRSEEVAVLAGTPTIPFTSDFSLPYTLRYQGRTEDGNDSGIQFISKDIHGFTIGTPVNITVIYEAKKPQ
jgi:hypothetical protein